MKTNWIVLLIATGCMAVPAMASSFYEDDIYYDPRKEVKNPEKPKAASTIVEKSDVSTGKVCVNGPKGSVRVYTIRDVDEYNRRMIAAQEQVLSEIPEDTVAPQGDYEFSERIRRFHNPDFTTYITDGEFVNIYLEDGADVTVNYIDGNRWMSPLYYDRYYMDSYYSYYDPFYRDPFFHDPYYYSYSYYRDPWYYPYYPSFGYYGYYGYGNPNYWDPWYYGGGAYYSYGYVSGSNSYDYTSLNRKQRDFLYGDARQADSRTSTSTSERTVRPSTGGVSTRSHRDDPWGTNGMGTTVRTYGSGSVVPGSVRSTTPLSSASSSRTVQTTTVRSTMGSGSTQTSPDRYVSRNSSSSAPNSTPVVTRNSSGSSTVRTGSSGVSVSSSGSSRISTSTSTSVRSTTPSSTRSGSSQSTGRSSSSTNLSTPSYTVPSISSSSSNSSSSYSSSSSSSSSGGGSSRSGSDNSSSSGRR